MDIERNYVTVALCIKKMGETDRQMDRQQANALSLSDTDEASIASTSASEVKTLWRYTNLFITRTHAHTHMHNHLTAFGLRQPRVGQYQKKHSPTHTHPDHRTSFINFLHLL